MNFRCGIPSGWWYSDGISVVCRHDGIKFNSHFTKSIPSRLLFVDMSIYVVIFSLHAIVGVVNIFVFLFLVAFLSSSLSVG